MSFNAMLGSENYHVSVALRLLDNCSTICPTTTSSPGTLSLPVTGKMGVSKNPRDFLI
ncbi:hypothetical protein CCACVL1_26724 [Corchorus capsularis]|uniref:Uncharacterized protein n=1 Tax=Corchorus capsularis TaxID=210143 RepID=A0A1R3GDJ5_COCAP|nr:hypothetical protein CCACVL1_26724 [Corchorus capsularis]